MKKKFKETGFGKFIGKVIGAVPDIAGDVLEIATSGNPIKTTIDKVGELLQGENHPKAKALALELEQSKINWEKELYQLDIKAFSFEVEDRKRASEQYIKTSHEIADKLALSIMNRNLVFIIALVLCQIVATVGCVFLLLKQLSDMQTAVTIGTSLGSVIGTAVGTIIGSLLQERNSVVGFHFGSSVERSHSNK